MMKHYIDIPAQTVSVDTENEHSALIDACKQGLIDCEVHNNKPVKYTLPASGREPQYYIDRMMTATESGSMIRNTYLEVDGSMIFTDDKRVFVCDRDLMPNNIQYRPAIKAFQRKIPDLANYIRIPKVHDRVGVDMHKLTDKILSSPVRPVTYAIMIRGRKHYVNAEWLLDALYYTASDTVIIDNANNQSLFLVCSKNYKKCVSIMPIRETEDNCNIVDQTVEDNTTRKILNDANMQAENCKLVCEYKGYEIRLSYETDEQGNAVKNNKCYTVFIGNDIYLNSLKTLESCKQIIDCQ